VLFRIGSSLHESSERTKHGTGKWGDDYKTFGRIG
jgi:hypothetical protein